MRLEGSGISRLAQVIQRVGYNGYDRFMLATVTSLLPTRIKIDGDSIEFDADDIILAGHLADRTLKMTPAGGTETEMFVKSPLSVGDRVIVVEANRGQRFFVIDQAVMI